MPTYYDNSGIIDFSSIKEFDWNDANRDKNWIKHGVHYTWGYGKKLKDIPEFETEDKERAFWATHSDLDFPHRFRPVKLYFPNLKRTENLSSGKKPKNKDKTIKLSPKPV